MHANAIKLFVIIIWAQNIPTATPETTKMRSKLKIQHPALVQLSDRIYIFQFIHGESMLYIFFFYLPFISHVDCIFTKKEISLLTVLWRSLIYSKAPLFALHHHSIHRDRIGRCRHHRQ